MTPTLIILIIVALLLIASIWFLVKNSIDINEYKKAKMIAFMCDEVVASVTDYIIDNGDEYCNYCKKKDKCSKSCKSVENCQEAVMALTAIKTSEKQFGAKIPIDNVIK